MKQGTRWVALSGVVAIGLAGASRQSAGAKVLIVAQAAAINGPAANNAAAANNAPAANKAPARKPIPESFLRMRRQQRDYTRGAGAGGVGASKPVKLDDILSFSLDHEEMQISAATTTGTAQESRRVEGSDAIWLIQGQPRFINQGLFGGRAVMQPGSMRTTIITRNDPGAKTDDALFSITISVSGENCSITGQSVLGQISINKSPGQISASVMNWSGNGGNGVQADFALSASATSILKLRAEHPKEFARYIEPMLEKLSDLRWLSPGAGDVYEVFTSIPADQAMEAKLRALLPDLGDDASSVRDAASARLAALGPGGVLAAMRIDRSDLSPEQSARLTQLINDARRRDFTDPAAERNDLNFLADCLEYDDPAVRESARAAIERAIGRPVHFDAHLSGAALTTASSAVRDEILEAQTAPATQPATAPTTRPTP